MQKQIIYKMLNGYFNFNLALFYFIYLYINLIIYLLSNLNIHILNQFLYVHIYWYICL